MEPDIELLSPTEAARRLSLGRTRLYELLGSGELPSVRVGALRRIPARALRAYVDDLVAAQLGQPEKPDRRQERANNSTT
jgi:excisionase family DNA binding protein